MASMTDATRADAIRPEAIPTIRRARVFYKVAAWITGVLLLLLVVEMILKYAFHLEVEIGGPFGAIATVQDGTTTAFNASRWILIIHGWFYVVYLAASYWLWMHLRWGLGWLLAMAAGGVVPFLSFITEHLIGRRADREIAAATAQHGREAAEAEELARVEASLTAEERARLDEDVRREAAARAAEGR